MAEIIGQSQWSPVRLLEENESARGGEDGNMNEQAKALVNRTEYLNQEKANKDDIVQGQFSFATLAEFEAKKALIPINSTVVIDEAGPNQGTNTWNGSTLKKSVYDPYVQSKAYVDSLNALILNKGKTYPFRKMTRNNFTSQESNIWNNSILDVRVNNADPTKYYQIAYQQNGALVNGKNEFNWIIYEFDKSKFETEGIAVLLVNYNDPGQQQLVKNGTIQTVNIKSLIKPKVSFTITCDTSGLAGITPINSTDKANPCWSFIIDPSCYVYEDAMLLSKAEAPRDWLYNKGPFYPFVQSAFNGSTSAIPTTFLSIFKDFEVINAVEGYFYQLAYYTNGNIQTGENNQERWIIHKRPRSGYTAVGATQEQIVSLSIPQATLIKSGGVEKIRLVSSGEELFDITVDTSKLPAYGTYITAADDKYAGYSWYMDPTNYRKKIPSISSVSNLNSYISYTASTKTFSYRYRSKDRNYEIVFGPNGANNLPNFKSIGSSTNSDLTGTFGTIQSFYTDWLPPLVFHAVNNPDDNNQDSFTGGNHASNGDATGDPTATNELYSIFVDGNVLNMAQDFSGTCKTIDIKLVHKLMASNTKTTSKRFCLKQIFDLHFEGSSINVHCKLKALEDIMLRSDYGPQLTTQGFQTTQLMLNAQQTNRTNYDVASTSGKRVDYEQAWAIILKGTGGILASWIDRNYGYGKPIYCAPDQALIRGGAGTNHKFYHCAFRSMYSEKEVIKDGVTFPEFPALLLTPSNQDYKWRGGYTIQSDNSSTGYDSVLKLDAVKSVINGVEYY